MAKLTEGIGIGIGKQTAEGTILATVRDATIIANDDDGAALSAGEAIGVLVRDDSLSFDVGRVEEEEPDVVGSFTRAPGTFLRSEIASFSFDVTVKGSGRTNGNPVAAGDFNLPTSIELLLEGAGLIRGTPTTSLTPYTFGTAAFLTMKVWRRDASFTMQDCRVASIAWKLTPGGIVVATVTIAPGAITFKEPDVFPTSINYGLVRTNSAPALKDAQAKIDTVTRGFLDGTFTIDNETEDVPDSNAVDGVVKRLDGRNVLWAGPFYVDSTDEDQDWANIIRTSGFSPSGDLQFRLGVAEPAVDKVNNSLLFDVENMVITAQKLNEAGNKVIWDLDGYATGTATGDNELTITSK